MKVRNLAGLLLDRVPDLLVAARRRKATDYGAILVGVAMIGAMQANTPMLDDSTVFAAAGTPPSQTTVVSQTDTQKDETTAVVAIAAPTVEPQSTPEPQPEAQSSVTLNAPMATPVPIQTPEPAQSPAQNPQPAQAEAQPQNPAPAATPQPAPATEQRPETSSRSERPAAPPQPTTPAGKFIVENAQAATESMHETGVPASVTLAQAVLESDSGRSGLSVKAHNYFGIKATTQPGPAGVVYMDTWEHVGGEDITVSQPFRAYNNAQESFADHGRYLRDNARYGEAMKHTDDARAFARLIHQAGYATDPAYASKLIGLMDKYDLYQYDR